MANKASRYQQPEVLADRMEKAGITHGATVRADIMGAGARRRPVETVEGGHLVAKAYGLTKIFFCRIPTNGFRVREVLSQGDGGAIHDKVIHDQRLRRAIGGLEPWSEINLINAIVSSNGSIHIACDDKTTIQVTQRRGQRVRETISV